METAAGVHPNATGEDSKMNLSGQPGPTPGRTGQTMPGLRLDNPRWLFYDSADFTIRQRSMTTPTSDVLFNERLTPQAGSLALLTAIFWGGMLVTVKIALEGVPPLALAGIRFVVGTVVVLIWMALRRIPIRFQPGEGRGLFQLAILFVAQMGVLNIGTDHTLAGRATVLNATYPFFTALFAHFMLTGDRLTLPKTIGMICSFIGIIIVFAESFALGQLAYLLGDLLALSSGMLLGLRMVYMKRLSRGIHPGRLLVWQSLFSIPIFFAFSLIFESRFDYQISLRIVSAILYQGVVVAGICFIVWTLLLRRYMASRLGVFHFATPLFGVFFSHLMLGEPVSLGLIASMLLVGVGIVIVNCTG